MSLSILEVDTSNPRHVRRYIRFPFHLYRDHPYWTPPMLSDARLQLDRNRYPFYQNNDAAFFLASREGEDLGRICVIYPRSDHAVNGGQDAYFYLFDAVDEQAVANVLFDAAAGWARARDLGELRGPLGFLAGDGFGLLADGFEFPPAFGIPYNYPYYIQLAERWGFEVQDRALSGRIDCDAFRKNAPQRVLDLASRIQERYGFEVKDFKTKRELRRWVVPRLGEIYERAFTHVQRDRHLTQDQLETIARRLLLVSDPRLLKFISRDDNIIGFIFCFLNVTRGIRRAGGRLFPFGWWHILSDLRQTQMVDANGIGFLPEHQGKGGPALLYAALYDVVMSVERIKYFEVVQILASNNKSLNEANRFGAQFYKTHHIYRKALS